MKSSEINLGVSAIATFVRRFPFDAGRWRFIAYALEKCRREITHETIRTVRTRHGFRMRVDVSEWFGRHVFVTGEYEAGTTNIIRACLKPGMSFIDVGANAGYFSLLAARCVGQSGQIRSFEPLPYIRNAFEQNLRLNQVANCEVFDVALSNSYGQAQLFAGPMSHPGTTSLRPLDTCSKQLSVLTTRLDDLLSADDKVDLIKIDVEGAECHVLEGMVGVLENCRPDIVLEVSPSYLAQMERSPSAINDLISQFGYRSYSIAQNGLRRLNNLADSSKFQFNAFLTTRETIPEGIMQAESS